MKKNVDILPLFLEIKEYLLKQALLFKVANIFKCDNTFYWLRENEHLQLILVGM